MKKNHFIYSPFRYLLLCMMIFARTLCLGQNELGFEHYGTDRGLSQASGYAISSYQNYIWVGTNEGLNRFDGYTMKVYRTGNESKLPNNEVYSLCVDAHNNFWAGTGEGIVCYNPKNGHFDTFSQKTSLHSALDSLPIRKIISHKVGDMWVLTYKENGIFRYNAHTKTLKQYLKGQKELIDMVLDKQGKAWLSSSGKIYYYDTQTDSFIDYKNLLTIQECRNKTFGTIAFDKANRLWAVSNEGGIFIINHVFKPTLHKRLVLSKDTDITTLYNDLQGRMWIGYRTRGGRCMCLMKTVFCILSTPTRSL